MNEPTRIPEQQPLIEFEDDAAVLFSQEEMKVRYTARQVSELERLREAVFMLLPAWPIEDIARRLHMNTRTVRALAAQDAEKLAGSKRDFTNVLRSTAARWLALARTRESEATFQQLAIGLGIIMDKARDLELMGLDGEKEFVKEDVDRVEAARRLRALMAGGAQEPAGVEAGQAGPARAEPVPNEAETPQPVVSCGAETGKPANITLEQNRETKSKPA
jgi:hypothetical protein